MTVALLSADRAAFHRTLLETVLTLGETGVPSNADKASRQSRAIGQAMIAAMGSARITGKIAGQTAGADFETLCARFIETAFGRLSAIRPGAFTVARGSTITAFDQYAHLAQLDALARSSREIAVAIGSDYLIKPDIVIVRHPVPDSEINRDALVVDDHIARHSRLRAVNTELPTLHASISCKWTIRSDRAQNARSEGLNLVRNRKGRLPHIAVITAEPMPGRLASLALGTGDIDCIYHIALPELQAAVAAQSGEDGVEMLSTMVQGQRLRDIADLPLDLAV